MGFPILLLAGAAATVVGARYVSNIEKPEPALNTDAIIVPTKQEPAQGVSAMLWVKQPQTVKYAAVAVLAVLLASKSK